MRHYLAALVAILATGAAHAANRYSFVNSQYIDENTDWATIAATQGYKISPAPVYYVTGQVTPISALQTCQQDGKIYAQIDQPVYRDQSREAAQIGAAISTVEVTANYQTSQCIDGGGQEHACSQSATVAGTQTLYTSFPLPVLAVQGYLIGLPVQFWPGAAFTKTYVVPNCGTPSPIPPTPILPPQA